MATIKNIQTFVKSREQARLLVKEMGGKYFDQGVNAQPGKRWLVVHDKFLKLGHSANLSSQLATDTKGKVISVMKKRQALSFHAFNMGWIAA